MKTKHKVKTDSANTVPNDTMTTNNFDAHGNDSRIAIDYGNDHKSITKNAYAIDNAKRWCRGRLSLVQVRLPASYKRAQDKTTVRKSEYTFYSDGLFLFSQTAQPDNALAVTTIPFTYDAPGRGIREDRDGTCKFIHRDTAHNHPGAANPTLKRVCDTPSIGGANLFDRAVLQAALPNLNQKYTPTPRSTFAGECTLRSPLNKQ